MRPSICIYNEFSGDADPFCPKTTLCWEPCYTEKDHLEPTPPPRFPKRVCIWEACQSLQDLTPKENSRKRWGFLFLQGMEVKFHCWFWEQFMLKLASGRKQRNHNSGLKWGHLGFYCISAPSVPLFTRQWGPAATGVEAHWLFCIWVQLAGKMAFFSEFFLPFLSCVCWPEVSFCVYHPHALLTAKSLERWSGWVSGCSHRQRTKRMPECQAQLHGGGTDGIFVKFFPLLHF